MSTDDQHRQIARPTIRDVARAAGVSIATVSRVINGRPDVAPATRDRVLGAVRGLGFSGNRSARSLVSGRTFLVGVTLPLVEAEYFSRIVAGAADELYDHDVEVVLGPTLHLRDRAATLLARHAGGATDGGLLILPEESNEELRALQRAGYPFVVIDPSEPLDEDIPSVSATNALGARAATEHLLPDWLSSVERLNGYRAALAAAGVVADPELVVESDWAVEGGEAAAALLLDLPDPPTAVFAFNDNMAIGTLRAARARGLSVPADFSVVGFDDSELATATTPALTTVRQPLAEMGRMAVTLLLRLLENRRDERLSIELQTRLIVRDSTAAPRLSTNTTGGLSRG